MTEGEQEMANLVSPGFSSCWLPGPDGESLRKIKMIWLTPFCQMASASASDIPATKQPSEKSSTSLTTTTTTKVLSHICDVFVTPTHALSIAALHADGAYSCPRSSERGALA